jgi:O-antigen/teichoic acid export membrane protein
MLTGFNLAFDLGALYKAIHRGIKTYTTDVFSLLAFRVDLLLVAYFLPMSSAGVYAIILAFSTLIYSFSGVVAQVLVIGSGNVAGPLITPRIIRMGWVISIPGALALVGMGPTFLSWILGENSSFAYVPLLILLSGAALHTLTRIIGSDLDALIGEGSRGWMALMTLLISIITGILLIPRYGIIGAATASTLARVFAAVSLAQIYSRSAKVGLIRVMVGVSNRARRNTGSGLGIV